MFIFKNLAKMLVLCMIFAFCCIQIAAQQCPGRSSSIKPKVVIIGDPVSEVTITWRIDDPSIESKSVSTQLYYHRASRNDSCDCNSLDRNIDAGCGQVSNGSNHMFTCKLSKDIIRDFTPTSLNSDSSCLVLEAQSGNWTEYKFLSCGTPFSMEQYCVNVCPPPTVREITPSKPRQFAVIFDASDKVNGTGLLEISIVVQYGKTLHQPLKNRITFKVWKPRNNRIVISGLEPFTQYHVQMCCFFGFSPTKNKRCPQSRSQLVTTAEEAPIRPPIVTDFSVSKHRLTITLKRPSRSTWNGHLVRVETNLWPSNDNCTAVTNNSDVKFKNITNDAVEKDIINVNLQNDETSCFRVRICTRPGCSPWSHGHKASLPKTRSKAPPLSSSVPIALIIGVVIAVIVVVLLVVAIVYICRSRPVRHHQSSLPSDVDTESLTTITDDLAEADDQHNYAIVAAS